MSNEQLTKTDRVINLILEITRAEMGFVTDKKLREVLGFPSKSQYHKYLNELIKSKAGREAILKREKTTGGFVYRLKQEISLSQKKKPKLYLIGQRNSCELKVYDPSRVLFSQTQIPKDLIESRGDYDLYKCMYEKEETFLREIFSFADDIEIEGPNSLKEKFIYKAQKAAFLNKNEQVTPFKKVA